jgi:hypothetical protein
MSETIQLKLSVQIAGGPGISTSRSLEVEAYDVISVDILGTGTGPDTDKEVSVQPGGANQVSFLAITSDRYGTGLTYSVNAAGTNIALDQPLVLVGNGAVGLLDPAPASLFFSSTLSEDASVQIIVGRDATP